MREGTTSSCGLGFPWWEPLVSGHPLSQWFPTEVCRMSLYHTVWNRDLRQSPSLEMHYNQCRGYDEQKGEVPFCFYWSVDSVYQNPRSAASRFLGPPLPPREFVRRLKIENGPICLPRRTASSYSVTTALISWVSLYYSFFTVYRYGLLSILNSQLPQPNGLWFWKVLVDLSSPYYR